MIRGGNISIKIKLKEGEFVQLITNPINVSDAQTSNEEYLARTRHYLYHVLTGDGSRPYCPFVGLIEENNGYYVRNFPEHPSGIEFDIVVNILGERFRQLSPEDTSKESASGHNISSCSI